MTWLIYRLIHPFVDWSLYWPVLAGPSKLFNAPRELMTNQSMAICLRRETDRGRTFRRNREHDSGNPGKLKYFDSTEMLWKDYHCNRLKHCVAFLNIGISNDRREPKFWDRTMCLFPNAFKCSHANSTSLIWALKTIHSYWPLGLRAGSWVRIDTERRLRSFGGTGFSNDKQNCRTSKTWDPTWLHKQPWL